MVESPQPAPAGTFVAISRFVVANPRGLKLDPSGTSLQFFVTIAR